MRLRAFLSDDAPLLAELAGAREIADTMLSLPHPLSLSRARSLIAANAASFQAGRSLHFALESAASPGLLGAVELLEIDEERCHAELRFWVARDVWGQRVASEAAREVLGYAFSELGLHRVWARHLERDPAAAAVLRRLGMKKEGVLREHVQHFGVFEDVAVYGVLQSERSRGLHATADSPE